MITEDVVKALDLFHYLEEDCKRLQPHLYNIALIPKKKIVLELRDLKAHKLD